MKKGMICSRNTRVLWIGKKKDPEVEMMERSR